MLRWYQEVILHMLDRSACIERQSCRYVTSQLAGRSKAHKIAWWMFILYFIWQKTSMERERSGAQDQTCNPVTSDWQLQRSFSCSASCAELELSVASTPPFLPFFLLF